MTMSMMKFIPPQAILEMEDMPTYRIQKDMFSPWRQKEKVVVVMGATGTGKSKISIDLAADFRAEIINSDKMQVHRGLDIVTNKLSEEEQRGIPHHLLGILHPETDFTAADFRTTASFCVESIISRGKLPMIVGGSNSYIEALIDDDYVFRSKYDCCFLCMDVKMPVLHDYISKRVDRMVEMGMVEEARQMFDPEADYSKGIRKAIGVPEFDLFFRSSKLMDKKARAQLLREAIQEIKDNTCKLACRQMEKINRLQNVKRWKIHRLDATDAFQKTGDEAEEAWEELVAGPSAMIVRQFLNGNYDVSDGVRTIRVPSLRRTFAAVTR